MSFSLPAAYEIEKLEAEVVSYDSDGMKHHWLYLSFSDRTSTDRMTVHFDSGALPKFQRLAALINETFGENVDCRPENEGADRNGDNATQETSSEV